MSSYQQQNQIKKQWTKKGDPNALSNPKWCSGECGGWIYWDPTASKTNSGKMIPHDVFTGRPHECPRNSRSGNYDQNIPPAEQPEYIPGDIVDAMNERKKAHKEKLANQPISKSDSPEIEVTTTGTTVSGSTGGGMQYTERQHNELITMFGLEQKILAEMKEYLEIIAKSVMHGPGFISTNLTNLQEEYNKKNEKIAGDNEKEGETEIKPQDDSGETAYQEYLKEMEGRVEEAAK